MPVLPIRLFGDPVLTIPAEEATTFDARCCQGGAPNRKLPFELA